MSDPVLTGQPATTTTDPYVDELLGETNAAEATAGDDNAAIVKELSDHVRREIGPIAKPKDIRFGENLPKTRSGKIMRRLLKDVAEGREAGDATTLADPSVMAQIQAGLKK